MKGDGIDLFDDRLKIEKDPKIRDRLRMLILLEEGYKQKQVAKIMRTTERTVYTWKKRYEYVKFIFCARSLNNPFIIAVYYIYD